MSNLEIETTLLAKYIPENILNFPKQEIIDIYIPQTKEHPSLRVRKNNEKFDITKKTKISQDDASQHAEHTITIDEEEFNFFFENTKYKLQKTRYIYEHEGRAAEIDIFKDRLTGLVLIDFEFPDEQERDEFQIPDFCLVDVTQEEFIAGGKLWNKTYTEIQPKLAQFGYRALNL